MIKIEESIVEDINNKCEELREKLLTKSFDFPEDFDDSGATISKIDFYIKHANQTELFKRMFNHYVETGEIVIPD